MQNRNFKLGCDLCEQICENKTDIPMDDFYENSYVYLKMCRNCDKPSCLEACSGDAIHLDKCLNQIIFDKECCVKCNMCIMVCPFDAIRSKEKYNYTCQSCDKYETLIDRIKYLNEAENGPLINDLNRNIFAKQLINKGLV